MKKISNYLPSAIIIGTILFFFGGPDYYSSRSIKHIWDLGHIIFYCILTIILLFNWNKLKLKSYYHQILWIIIITLFLGLIVEYLQTRKCAIPDTGDLTKNFIGSFTTLFFFAPKRKEINFIKLYLCKGILTLIIIFQIIPIINFVWDERNAIIEFPMLSGFESQLELSRWEGDADYTIDNDIKNTGNSSLKIVLNTSKYSGVFLKYFPKDWDSYNILSFKIYNPQNDFLKITCRIHDKMHTEGNWDYADRFNKTYTLLEGWNTIVINFANVLNAPLKRTMNMKNIHGFGIFVISQKENKTIYLDNVVLIK